MKTVLLLEFLNTFIDQRNHFLLQSSVGIGPMRHTASALVTATIDVVIERTYSPTVISFITTTAHRLVPVSTTAASLLFSLAVTIEQELAAFGTVTLWYTLNAIATAEEVNQLPAGNTAADQKLTSNNALHQEVYLAWHYRETFLQIQASFAITVAAIDTCSGIVILCW